MKLFNAAFVLVLVLGASATAQAQEKPKKRPDAGKPPQQQVTADVLLSRADADRDGKVSKEEFLREAYAKFVGKDKAAAAKRAKGLDKDEDGEISFEEFAQAPRAQDQFKKLDKDGSEALERPELEAMATDMGRERRKGLPEFVKRYDDDGDGKVTKEEFNGPDPVFARLDRNRAGSIGPGDEPPPGAPPAPPKPPEPPPAPPAPRGEPQGPF